MVTAVVYPARRRGRVTSRAAQAGGVGQVFRAPWAATGSVVVTRLPHSELGNGKLTIPANIAFVKRGAAESIAVPGTRRAADARSARAYFVNPRLTDDDRRPAAGCRRRWPRST